MKTNLGTEILYTFWSQRDVSERRTLLLGGGVALLAFVYLVGIDPALTGRKKLEKDVPQLRQQVAEIQFLSQQFAQFSGALSDNIEPITKETIESTLSRRGMKAESLTVSDGVVRLQLKQVDYGNLMDGLMELQKANRMSVEEAKITALTDPAQVDALLTLKQQKR
jgi:general secretion pathway protein M